MPAWRTRPRAALQATIDTDLAGLVDIYHDQKIDGLTARLQERLDLAPTAGERPLYILLDKDGKALIGQAAQWPNCMPTSPRPASWWWARTGCWPA